MPSLPTVRIVTALPALLVLAGCATMSGPTQQEVRSRPTRPCGIVLVAEGAGNIGKTTRLLQQVADEEKRPLQVLKIDWSHGTGRVLADQTDFAHARAQGERLAQRIVQHRRAEPACPVSLVAYCAGSAVVLSAADFLPPDSVEEIILLSPSVSKRYDVRPALRASRRGLDVFYSEFDLGFLGLGAVLVGTADRRWDAPAGRVGFAAEPQSEADRRLFQRLRQHGWQPGQWREGYLGGHGGSQNVSFLRRHVFPLLAPPPEGISPEAGKMPGRNRPADRFPG